VAAGEGASGYVALAGCASLSLFLLCLGLGVPRTAAPPGAWSRALTLGAGLALAPLAGFAYALQVATHHRPLGAATFALGALLVVALCVLLARSALQLAQERPRFSAALVYAMSAAGVLGAVLVLLWLRRSVMQHATPALDVALGAVIALVLVHSRWRWLERWPRLARSGLPTCCMLWLASLWLMRSDVDVRATVKSAPILAGVVGLVLR
jgi:hypothetical protein